MPGIGDPNAGGSNTFGNIKIRTTASERLNTKSNNTGDELNKIAGVKPESRFVDAKTHNKLGKDGFLKLLSHQLANQDPMKPMDQKRFAADLAQFSQLEQLANMNTKMDESRKNDPAQSKFLGASFLGKKVMTEGTTIEYKEGDRPVLPFYLEKPAKHVMIRIFDSSNNMTRQMEFEGMGSGSQAVTWDGISADGYAATKDTYRFEVRAYDKGMQEFKGETRAEGLVTGVHFENGETVLTVEGGKKVFLRDVKEFKLPKMTGGANNMPTLKKQANSAYNNIVQQNQ